MAKLVSIFLSRRRQNAFTVGVGLFAFAMFALLFAIIGVERLEARARAEADEVLADFAATGKSITYALGLLEHQAAGLVCGEAMQAEMRRVAFLPDGLNEFFFVPDGAAHCSTNAATFVKPHAFGTPDAGTGGRLPFEVWFASDLRFAGYAHMVGSIVRSGNFAVVLRPPETRRALPDWLTLEGVLIGDGGRVWPFNGTAGVYADAAGGGSGRARSFAAYQVMCDAARFHCVGARADLLAGLAADRVQLTGGLGLAAALAAGVAAWARRAIARRFSFEERFVRHLDAQSLVCAYQPIIDVASGQVVGCEVLARWRDIDDSLVSPDRFIPVVEQRGMTLAFTRLVIEKAHAELRSHIPASRRLQVNVNVFPADIGKPELAALFRPFVAEPERFAAVAEIVETEALDIPAAQRQIETLRQMGVRTYIDDFGCGYSNIHNLAALAVDGVKLDRSFAMAPEGSVMARMLGHAVEMVHAAGRAIVVEGVETAERLTALRALPAYVDYAQGYHIARPLPIEVFAAFPEAVRVEVPLARAA